jgi:hypothetical protein
MKKNEGVYGNQKKTTKSEAEGAVKTERERKKEDVTERSRTS